MGKAEIRPACFGDHIFGQTAAERGCHDCLLSSACKTMTAETDPHGLSPHTPGAKLDKGKPIAAEIILGFPHAMTLFVAVADHGAEKYSRWGFLEVPDHRTRYLDACMRHLLKVGMGEENDPDSGLPHLAHAMWCLAAILEIDCRKEAP